MVEIGKFNTLKIVKDLDFGVYLDGGDGTEILLPARYVPHNVKPGDDIEVFIYRDNEERLIATTERPMATVGEFAFMEVKQVNDVGAFLDWGLMKDLLVPYKEQKMAMKEGKWYLVYVRIDEETNRIMASARIEKFLDNVPPEYSRGEEVNILIADETDLGYRVIINNLHTGLVYANEVYDRIERGQKMKGYIKEVREDGKIDVSLTPLGYRKINSIAIIVLNALVAKGGYLAVHDKSEPEEIYSLFRCSKKAFKQAIGALYREEYIVIEDEGIRLTDEGKKASEKGFTDQADEPQEKRTFPSEHLRKANDARHERPRREDRPERREDRDFHSDRRPREPHREDRPERRDDRDFHSDRRPREPRREDRPERRDDRDFHSDNAPRKTFSLDKLRPIKGDD